MSKKSMNMILANWVHSRVCESCRETGAGTEFAQHDDCKNHLSVINWLLGGQTGDRELQGMRQWVRSRSGGVKQWRAIEEKMQREIARRAAIPRVEWQDIGPNNKDYWESWQEGHE